MPLDDALVSMLRAHKARQAAEKLAAGPAYDDGGWLLADELGAPCHPESLSTWFERRVSELGLPRIRLHDTRHTAASLTCLRVSGEGGLGAAGARLAHDHARDLRAPMSPPVRRAGIGSWN